MISRPWSRVSTFTKQREPSHNEVRVASQISQVFSFAVGNRAESQSARNSIESERERVVETNVEATAESSMRELELVSIEETFQVEEKAKAIMNQFAESILSILNKDPSDEGKDFDLQTQLSQLCTEHENRLTHLKSNIQEERRKQYAKLKAKTFERKKGTRDTENSIEDLSNDTTLQILLEEQKGIDSEKLLSLEEQTLREALVEDSIQVPQSVDKVHAESMISDLKKKFEVVMNEFEESKTKKREKFGKGIRARRLQKEYHEDPETVDSGRIPHDLSQEEPFRGEDKNASTLLQYQKELEEIKRKQEIKKHAFEMELDLTKQQFEQDKKGFVEEEQRRQTAWIVFSFLALCCPQCRNINLALRILTNQEVVHS